MTKGILFSEEMRTCLLKSFPTVTTILFPFSVKGMSNEYVLRMFISQFLHYSISTQFSAFLPLLYFLLNPCLLPDFSVCYLNSLSILFFLLPSPFANLLASCFFAFCFLLLSHLCYENLSSLSYPFLFPFIPLLTIPLSLFMFPSPHL
jgi:hypothetical protein